MAATLNLKHTKEHPGVKAPGTANISTFPDSHSFPVLTTEAGVFSKRSTDGRASPT